MKNLKEIAESPLVRVANFFLMLCITLLGAILLRAESNVKSEIEKNENKIQVLEGKVSALETSAVTNTVTLGHIKEMLELIRQDIKDIKNR